MALHPVGKVDTSIPQFIHNRKNIFEMDNFCFEFSKIIFFTLNYTSSYWQSGYFFTERCNYTQAIHNSSEVFDFVYTQPE
jgi:hypothetical protein